MIYLISYKPAPLGFSLDLFRDTDNLVKELKSYPGWCKCFDSAWLIATTEDIETVSKKIAKYFDSNNFWLVATLSEQICGGLSPDAWSWLKECRINGY